MKLRNIVSKALILATVVVSSMAMGAVSTFADTFSLTITANASNKECTVSTDGRLIANVNSNSSNTAGGKLDVGSSAKISASFTGLTNGKFAVPSSVSSPYFVGVVAEAGDTISVDLESSSASLKMVRVDTLNLTSTDKNLTVANATEYDTQSPTSSGTVSFKQIETAGTYLIYNVNTKGSIYISKVSYTTGTAKTKYTVSGTVTGLDEGETVTIGTETLTVDEGGKYTVSLAGSSDGEKYDVAVSNGLKEVSPATITVKEVNQENVDITVTKKAVTTLTGTIDENLTTTTDNVKFTSTDGTVYTATVDADGSYSVVLPNSATYTISLLDNKGYKTTAYEINETSVSVGTEEKKTFNLTCTKITEWSTDKVGKTLPDVTIQLTEGTYKGIAVNASATYDVSGTTRNAKFASASGQVNSKTVLTVPLDSSTEELEITANDSNKVGYTVSYSDNSAVITVGDVTSADKYSTYITSIKIVKKDVITKANAGKVAYAKIGNAEYAIAIVDGDKTEKADITGFYITDNNDNSSNTISEVYKNITIGDNTYSISDFTNSENAYIYGFKVTGSNSDNKSAVEYASVAYEQVAE